MRAGDDDAFEIIYDRYYRGLLAFCGQMLGSRQEAEDALQHSFASAYRAMRDGSGDIDLRPWLYTIARNRCLSALRARRAEIAVDEIAAGARPVEGLVAHIERRADLRELVAELQRLPEDQRAALVLFELGDESHEQIAAVLGVRREKVKALVFQAREALLRARAARETPCVEIREQLATLTGRVPRRSIVRSHLDRCPGCAEFERDVRRQRASLAVILPLVPTAGLKASVLGFALGGGGGAVALGGAGAGGGATVAAGGALAVGGMGGGGVAGTAGAAAAGAIGTAGAATVATGLATGGGAGLASLPAKGVVAKILAVVALGGGGTQAEVHHRERAQQPAAASQPAMPAPIAPATSYPPAAARPPAAAAAAQAPNGPADVFRAATRRVPAPSPPHTAAAPAPTATPTTPTTPADPAPTARRRRRTRPPRRAMRRPPRPRPTPPARPRALPRPRPRRRRRRTLLPRRRPRPRPRPRRPAPLRRARRRPWPRTRPAAPRPRLIRPPPLPRQPSAHRPD